MITTTEIVLMIILVIGLGISIWWFVVAEKYRRYLKTYSYARGANALNGQTVNLECEAGKEICIYRATQICTKPDSNNFESSSLDAIASGNDGSKVKYGDFNPQTTIDLTHDMANKSNGKEKSSYTFNVHDNWTAPNGITCNGASQLLATYACVPKGVKCNTWSAAN